MKLILDLIDNIPNVNFIWHENFYNVLFSDQYKNAENLYKNHASLMSKLFSKFYCVKEFSKEAIAEPDILLIDYSIKTTFLKVVYKLIEESTSELPFINKDISHKFKNEYDSKVLNTTLISSIQDFIKFAKQDLYNLFWPNKKEDFENYFSLLIRFKELELRYDSNKRKYSRIEYSSKFINSVCKFEQVFRDKCIESFVTRIHLSQEQAKRTSLKDEPLVNSNNRRFYITRDNGRIHYNYPKENCIKFIELSLDHDKGL